MSSLNKILVVGAGIAGPALCYWLRKFGFFPSLIESAPQIRKGGQGLDVRGAAIDVAKKMGIYEKICSMRTQLESGCYVDAEGNILHEEKGEKFGFRKDQDVEIRRGDLVEILINLIEEVPCRFGCNIDAIEERGDQVEVHFTGKGVELYDLVIGADGLHSTTRKLVFYESEYSFVNFGLYFCTFGIPNYLNLHHSQVHCEIGEKLVSVMSDREPSSAEVAFMFRGDANHIRNQQEQKKLLYDTFKEFGWEVPKLLQLMASSSEFYFDSLMQIKMASWAKGRVALLGDAAYCASLLSGQGNNLALIGAYILAGELKRAEGNYVSAFENYQMRLRSFVEANQKLGAWVSESFLVLDQVSKQAAKERSNRIMEEVQLVANMISLPNYE